MNSKHLALTAIGGLLFSAHLAESYSGGIPGRSSIGCGEASGCHATAPSNDTTVTLSVPSSVTAGSTVNVSVSVSSPVPTTGLNQGGFNLKTSSGAFVPGGAIQAFSSREVGHTAGTNDQRSWTVPWKTTPATRCNVIFNAASNAVNGNGTPGPEDHWNLATATVYIDATGDSTAPSAPVFVDPSPGNAYIFGSKVPDGLAIALVVGDVKIAVTVTDNSGIDHVELTDSEAISGGPPQTLGNAGYNGSQFTRLWSPSPGLHTLTANAVDCNGNSRASSVQVYVL